MGVSIADMSDPAYGVGCRSNSPASDPPIVCESDLAISTTFFSTFPQSVYLVELNATNSQEASGGDLAQLSARVNVLSQISAICTYVCTCSRPSRLFLPPQSSKKCCLLVLFSRYNDVKC